MMDVLEFERMSLRRRRLSEDERRVYDRLEAEDERVGSFITQWFAPLLLGGWFLLVLTSSMLLVR